MTGRTTVLLIAILAPGGHAVADDPYTTFFGLGKAMKEEALAMPTMGAAFAHDMWDVRHSLSADRAAEIGVGFVLAFVAAALVVKPFLEYVGRSGFAPFAWYRIAAGIALLAAIAAGWI